MHHQRPQPFPDEFDLGPHSVARHRLEIAEAEMAKTGPIAFSPGYENEEVRAMNLRRYNAARAMHERATAILQWEEV